MLQFFTFGGKQFWEDVFYYQKWRIQRHYRTNKYRLLDNWDICRAKGSFEDCRKAFVKYIEIYEINRQSGKMVILLHGLGKSKNMFKPLIKPLEECAYNVVAINYPSTRKSLEKLSEQFNFFLSHTEDISEVSFITHKESCLLLRCLFSLHSDWQTKFKIGKIINIDPVNTGSQTCAVLSRFKIFRFIYGPSLTDCCPENAEDIPTLPKNIPLALIFCETYFDKLLSPLKSRFKGIDVPGDKQEKDFSSFVLKIKNVQKNIFKNQKLIHACTQFLREGKL